MTVDVQVVTLVEAACLLAINGVGLVLTALAWRVSDVDVREATVWEPAAEGPWERTRRRYNRVLVTEDARYGEMRRLQAHILVALVGVFWLLTPQPTNPDVVWWAVAIRCAVILLSGLLIDKTLHHLIARWRFDRPEVQESRLAHVWPALRLAWRDMQAIHLVHRT